MENEELLTQIDLKLKALKEELAHVIVANAGDLHTQINERCDVLHDDIAGVNKRLDSIDRKVSLHAGALAHIVEWSSKVEEDVVRLSAAVVDVQARLLKLENRV